MDSLLKASENFEQVNNDFDEKVFVEFMKQITIWDYYGLSKDNYLALPEPEKRVKISVSLIVCLRCLKTSENV